jgi:hypothetical protein
MVGDGVTGPWKVPGEFGKDVVVTKANTTALTMRLPPKVK